MASKINIDGTNYSSIKKGIIKKDGTIFNITKGLTKITDEAGTSVKEIIFNVPLPEQLYLFGTNGGVSWDEFNNTYVIDSLNMGEASDYLFNVGNPDTIGFVSFKLPENWKNYNTLIVDAMNNAQLSIDFFAENGGASLASQSFSSSAGFILERLIPLQSTSIDNAYYVLVTVYNGFAAIYNIYLGGLIQ